MEASSSTELKKNAVNKLSNKDVINSALFSNNMCNSLVMSLSTQIRCGLQLQTLKGGVSSDVYTRVHALRTSMAYMCAIHVAITFTLSYGYCVPVLHAIHVRTTGTYV